MADRETSFIDRHSKAQLLLNKCIGFSPAFAPPDTGLETTAFGVFLGNVEGANNTVSDLNFQYKTASEQRVAALGDVMSRMTQGVNYVKSNAAWAPHYLTAKRAVDHARGTRPPKKVTPPSDPPPSEPEAKPRNRGQQAFEEMAGHFRDFVIALTNTPGYAPPSADISIASLNALLSSFRNLNTTLSQLEAQLTAARKTRFDLYYAEGALADKFQAIKAAVKGQYGAQSTQWAEVKGMRW